MNARGRGRPRGGAGISHQDDNDSKDSHSPVHANPSQRPDDHDDSKQRDHSPPQHSKSLNLPGRKIGRFRPDVGQHDAISLDRDENSERHAATGSHDSTGDADRRSPEGDNEDSGPGRNLPHDSSQNKKFKFKKTNIEANPALEVEPGPTGGQPAASGPKAGAAGDSDEEAGAAGDDAGLGDRRAQWNKGMKKRYKAGSASQGDSVDNVDLSAMPEIAPGPAGQQTDSNATGPAATSASDGFDDKNDDSLTRIQRRINAIRKGGRQSRIAISEDDPDLEVVDTNLVASLDMIKKRRKTVYLKDEEEQRNMAIALAIKAKWPEYVAMGVTVVFVLTDIALLVLGVTQEFNLINIDSLELIEGVVELVKIGFETAQEAVEAKRNGRGESKEVMEKRKEAGLKALMELTGVDRLNAQQKAIYDTLRGLRVLEQKEENEKERQGK
jgi:hypothetical protein